MLHALDCFLGNDEQLTHSNVYSCFKRFWTEYDTDDVCIVKSSFDCVDMICYIHNHKGVEDLACSLGLDEERLQKASLAMDIVLAMRKIWTIDQKPLLVDAVVALQRKWRRHLNSTDVMGPYPSQPAVNTEDIFTLEPLSTLPANKIFSFKDATDQVFAFNAMELSAHVFKFDHTFNPYTRLEIPTKDLHRLRRWFRKQPVIPDVANAADAVAAQITPMQAFTQVTSEFELTYGLFTQPQWFVALDEYEIMSIFQRFHRLAGHGCPFMDIQVDDTAFETGNVVASQLGMAQEMHRMITEGSHPYTFFYVCCLFTILCDFSHPIQMSIPAWVYDVAGVQ